jgi:hypothetical protein
LHQDLKTGPLMRCTIVLQEIEREDQAWEQSKSKPKHGRNLDEDNAAAKSPTKVSPEVEKTKPKTNAPSGFY